MNVSEQLQKSPDINICQRSLDGKAETKISCINCSTLTFRGTEKFAVRMMASAIAWAYQG